MLSVTCVLFLRMGFCSQCSLFSHTDSIQKKPEEFNLLATILIYISHLKWLCTLKLTLAENSVLQSVFYVQHMYI